MKRAITILLLSFIGIGAVKSQTTYNLNYGLIRYGLLNGTTIHNVLGDFYLRNIGLGASTDSIVSILNGKLRKVPVSQFESALTFSAGLTRTSNTVKADTTVLQTVLNFFPKGDTRYYTKTLADGRYVSLSGSYADPSWIISLAKSKVGLGGVENTALSTWAGSSNITTLGTIGTGVWNGTAIGDAYISSAATWNAKQAALSGTGILSFSGTTPTYLSSTGTGDVTRASGPTITSPIITNISPGANFTLTQNSVVPFTSVNSGAVANTLYLNAGKAGIGTSSVNYKLDVLGSASDWSGHFKSSQGSQPDVYIADGSGNGGLSINTHSTSGSEDAFNVSNGTNILFNIRNSGTTTAYTLAGTGTRMVVADNLGTLSTQAIPSGGGGGTVASVSVNSSNGFAGTSSGGANPALTLSTTISGLLKGNGTAISAETTTGTGDVVRSTSPTLVTPALGTPSSLVGTNITGTASGLTAGTASAVALGGITGLGTNVATALATNIGTNGSLIQQGGNAGTPSSINLTNGTSLPVSTGISGLGTTVATALAINVGTVGSFIQRDGAGGTPSSLVGTNITGTASGLNIGGNAATASVAPAGTLTGSTLASGVTASSLASAAGGIFGTNAFNSTAFAPLASPALTGTPTAPTATTGTNTTQLATTAFVQDAITATGAIGTTYNPTTYSLSNVSSVGYSVGHVQRIGNEVHVEGVISPSASGAGTCIVKFDLPIASNLATSGDIAGPCSSATTTSTIPAISADATNDKVTITYVASAALSTNISYSFSYTVQ